jgi:hypothetical protein
MPSVIDPNVLVDGQPVVKESLRQTLAAARQEMDHGGFTTIAGGTELRVADALAGRWVDVRAFGAAGDGAADDTAQLQAAIDSGLPLYFPPGSYRITAPLVMSNSVRMKGAGGKKQGGNYSQIIGAFPNPLIHWSGVIVDHNDVLVENTPAPSGGQYFIAEDMLFTNNDIDGCCIQTYNCSSPTGWYRCGFEFFFRGLLILQGFDNAVFQCYFQGNHFTSRTIADGHWERAYGLWTGGHTNIIGSNFMGCGTAAVLTGPEANFIGSRIEVGGNGIVSGTNSTLSPDIFGGRKSHDRSLVSGISMESNYRHLTVLGGSSVSFENIGIQGGTNGPSPDGIGDYGAWFEGGEPATSSVHNLVVAGAFKRYPVYIIGRQEFSGLNSVWTGPDNAMSAVPFIGGSTRPFGDADGDWELRRFPANPHEPGLISSSSDLHLRGLKGLNLIDKAQPNNLGGLEAVIETATSQNVAFRGAATVTLNDPSAAGSGSQLGAGTYYYARTAIGPRGESSIDYDFPLGAAYKTVTVGAGQEVTLSGNGAPAYARNRWYRGTAPGQFDGFYENTQNPFVDTGAAFDGYGAPPVWATVPSQAEPDDNYAIVATPSWDTRVWVTSKATNGFILNFSNAAPTGATVQWLLFRP